VVQVKKHVFPALCGVLLNATKGEVRPSHPQSEPSSALGHPRLGLTLCLCALAPGRVASHRASCHSCIVQVRGAAADALRALQRALNRAKGGGGKDMDGDRLVWTWVQDPAQQEELKRLTVTA